ncbi:cation:proton antiporter [soil metagenome]
MVLLIGGCTALVAAWVPAYTARRPLSLPLVLVALGVGLFLVPLGLPRFVPSDHLALIERVTEIGVLVSLMGAGLKIDRLVGWKTWSSTWRLLAIGMPLAIVASAFLGWWGLGLGAASALLLGSVLAPTDPVLAADVQVGEPEVGDEADLDSEDQVRFTLTSEAGLNDALAFPFVYAAIRLADHGFSPAQLLEWIGVDLIYRLGVGLLVGLAVGWLIGRISFSAPGPLQSLAESPQGFVAIAVMLMAYGATQLLGGYGFLAVFVSAVALRSAERRHEFHTHLHEFVEQSENLLTVGMLVLMGGALVGGALSGLTWQAALVAAIIVLVVRPVTSYIALAGETLTGPDRAAIAVFGIKGIGSLYYLAYALEHHEFPHSELLWATVLFAILVSIVFHGVTATPAMRVADRSRSAWSRARHRRHDRHTTARGQNG